MIWECNEYFLCECGRCQLSGSRRRKLFPVDAELQTILPEVYQSWYDVVTAYSARSLTCTSDKLPAISGVASKISDQIQGLQGGSDSYVAGLWRGDIARGLLWCYGKATPFRPFTRKITPEPIKNRYPEYHGPTWSWASTRRTVHWWHRPSDQFQSAVRIIEANAVPAAASNPLGEILSARLVLSGPTYRGLKYTDRSSFLNTVRGLGMELNDLDMDEDDEITVQHGPIEVILLYIGSSYSSGFLLEAHYVLILQQSLSGRAEDMSLWGNTVNSFLKPTDLYKRVGIGMQSIFMRSEGASEIIETRRAGGEIAKHPWASWRRETIELI